MQHGEGGKKRETLSVPVASDAEGGAAPRRRAAPVALRVMGTGRELSLPGSGRFRIGSGSGNDLVLDDEYVSTEHCTLERHGPERLILRDRRSRNGTWLNGVRVDVADVDAGSRIVVGRTALGLLSGRRRRSAPAIELLVGEDRAFREAVDLALRAARSSSNVLVLGESGSGKELVARLVHEASARVGAPFVALNCGAITRDLIAAELFGHERGAFTGAEERRHGLFEQADGGTLFLDEVGELPSAQQPSLLRALESRRVRRVGGEGEKAIDVRVVAATNGDLRSAAAAGAFRLDLYHRLAGIEVRLPSLRERPGDIPLLAQWFLAEAVAEYGPRSIAMTAIEALMRYPWPGNVRELRNAIHRAAALSDAELRLEDLLPSARPVVRPPRMICREPTPTPPDGTVIPDGVSIDHMIRQLMERTLHRFGSIRRAASALGMSKSTFHDRMRRYGIALPKAEAE